MKQPSLYLLVFLVLCVLFPADLEAQCSMCRAVLESEEGQTTAKGINDGIIYLMAMPYLLVAGVGYVVYRMMHR